MQGVVRQLLFTLGDPALHGVDRMGQAPEFIAALEHHRGLVVALADALGRQGQCLHRPRHATREQQRADQ